MMGMIQLVTVSGVKMWVGGAWQTRGSDLVNFTRLEGSTRVTVSTILDLSGLGRKAVAKVRFNDRVGCSWMMLDCRRRWGGMLGLVPWSASALVRCIKQALGTLLRISGCSFKELLGFTNVLPDLDLE